MTFRSDRDIISTICRYRAVTWVDHTDAMMFPARGGYRQPFELFFENEELVGCGVPVTLKRHEPVGTDLGTLKTWFAFMGIPYHMEGNVMTMTPSVHAEFYQNYRRDKLKYIARFTFDEKDHFLCDAYFPPIIWRQWEIIKQQLEKNKCVSEIV